MIKVSITTKPQKFPIGTIAGLLLYTLTSDAGYQSQQESTEVEVIFEDAIAPGTYTATACRIDSAGNPLGDAVTGTFTTDVTIDVPDVVTLSLA